MKGILLVLLLFGLFDFSFGQVQPRFNQPKVNVRSNNNNKGNHRSDNSAVYICLGKSAYAYHRNEYCYGLNNCKATIIFVIEQEAVNKYNRKPCTICYH